MLKRRGLTKEPWGTPLVAESGVDIQFSISTICFRLISKTKYIDEIIVYVGFYLFVH